MSTITAGPGAATSAQINYAMGLYLSLHGAADEDGEGANALSEILHGMSKAEASKVIDTLKGERAAKMRAVAADLAVAEQAPQVIEAAEQITGDAAAMSPGMYLNGEQILKVQKSRQSGHLYAKVLVQISGNRLLDETEQVVNFEFRYAAGAIHSLTPAMRMPLADAVAFGIRYGICCNCGKSLKDAKSVALGIGPVCRKHFA